GTWNKFARVTGELDFAPRHELDGATLVSLFAWSEEVFLRKTEGSAIRRIGYECWLRNIAVALGNAPTSAAVIGALGARRDHPSALVREHVEWALQRHAALPGWREKCSSVKKSLAATRRTRRRQRQDALRTGGERM